MLKIQTVRKLMVLVNLVIIGSFFLPYRVVNNFSSSLNRSFVQFNGEVEYQSVFEFWLPLFCFVLLIPITIIIFTSKHRIARIINIILTLLLILFTGLCFFITTISFFATSKPGIGVYIFVVSALFTLYLTIIHYRIPVSQDENKELLDRY